MSSNALAYARRVWSDATELHSIVFRAASGLGSGGTSDAERAKGIGPPCECLKSQIDGQACSIVGLSELIEMGGCEHHSSGKDNST